MSRYDFLMMVCCFALCCAKASADDEPLTYGKAIAAYSQNDFQRAYDQLSELLELGEPGPLPYYFRGLASSRLGNQHDAEADFEKAAELEGSATVAVTRALERIQGVQRVIIEQFRAGHRTARNVVEPSISSKSKTEQPKATVPNETVSPVTATATSPSASEQSVIPGLKIEVAPPKSAPGFVDNLVIVYNQQIPGRPICGVYFKQVNGRSIIAFPSTFPGPFIGAPIDPTKGQFFVVYHPGQPDQRILSASGLSGGSFAFLQINAELPPPVETDWSNGDSTSETVKLYGFESSDAPASMWDIRFVEQTLARDDLDTIASEQLLGSLVCDSQGVPDGLLTNQRRIRRGVAVNGPSIRKAVASLRQMLESTRPAAVGSLKYQQVVSGRAGYHSSVICNDPLRMVDEIRLFVGQPEFVKPGVKLPELTDSRSNPKLFDLARTDHLLFRNEQLAGLQQMPPTADSYRRWNGLYSEEASAGETPTPHVTQVHMRLETGEEFYSAPLLLRPGNIDTVLLTNDRLAELGIKLSPDEIVPEVYAPHPVDNVLIATLDVPKLNNKPNLSVGTVYSHTLSPLMRDDSLLPDVAWSPDGQFVWVLSQFGRLYMLNLNKHAQVRYLDLLEWCADFDLSAAGLVVLSQGSLHVISPETLRIRRTISVPNAILVATATSSTEAIVVGNRRLWQVDLETGIREELTIRGSDQSIPTGHFMGAEIKDNGDHIVLTDRLRIHRLVRGPNASLIHEQSSPEITEGRLIFQQGDNRVAVRGYGVTKPVSKAGFPHGNTMIFALNDLDEPIAGSNGNILFDPFTGGILGGGTFNSAAAMNHADGYPHSNLSPPSLELGAFSPTGGRVLLLEKSSLGVAEYILPDGVYERDILRRPGTGHVEPVVEEFNLKTLPIIHENWTATKVALPVDESTTPRTRPRNLAPNEYPVESVAWSDSGDSCFVLTVDGILHEIQIPELIEKRRLEIGNCVDLQRSKEGLIVNSKWRQELILIDQQTLKIKRRIPVAARNLLTAAAESSTLWFTRSYVDDTRQNRLKLHSLDLITGKEGAAVDQNELRQMLMDHQSPHSFPRAIYKIQDIKVTPDGKYLFLSDGQCLYRFVINGESLAFEDATGRLTSQKAGRIVVSSDSKFVSLPHGRMQARPTYPPSVAGRGYGSFVFPVSDFDTVAVDVATERPGNVLDFNPRTGQVYTLTDKTPLLVFGPASPEGKPAPFNRSEIFGRFYVDPGGRGMLVAGSGLFWVSSKTP